MSHPKDDLLQRYLDGDADVVSRDRVSAHLAACPRCRRRRRDLEDLVLSLRTLPASISPPDDLWAGIAARIESRDGRNPKIDAAAARAEILPRRRRDQASRFVFGSLAAAAILLAGFALGRVIPRPSGAITAAPEIVSAPPATSFPAGRSATAVSLVDDDLAYDQSIAELRAVLAAMDDVLLPETVAAIEANLRIIDTAIEEAGTALAADPASDFLRRRISIHRQTKLDVLRAAIDAAGTIGI